MNACTNAHRAVLARQKLAGLYAVTPTGLAQACLLEQVVQALRGGASIVQYRDKSRDHHRRQQNAKQLLELTRAHHALLIINDDLELALASGADGVHLGEHDTSLAAAREKLGAQAIIGISCYNRFDLAQQAAARGADYIAFGRFFPSRTKAGAVQADTALLTRAKQELALPVAAIGGINAGNCKPLIEAGADMLAMVEGIFAAPDIEAAARQCHALFLTQNQTKNSCGDISA